MFSALRNPFRSKEDTQEQPKPLKSFVAKAAEKFRGAYQRVTSVVKESYKQPALIPLQQQSTPAIATIEKPILKEEPTPRFYDQAFAQVKNGIFKILHEKQYKGVLQVQDTIDQINQDLQCIRDKESPAYEKLQNVLADAQMKMRSVHALKLSIQDGMTREDMAEVLKKSGYQRMRRGDTGYAALYNTLGTEDRQYVQSDGSIWVHNEAVRVAESQPGSDAVLNTCWEMVDEGITPIYHLPRLMQLMGFEALPAAQQTYGFAPSNKAQYMQRAAVV